MLRASILCSVALLVFVTDALAFSPPLHVGSVSGLRLRATSKSISHSLRRTKPLQVKAELDDSTAGILGGVGLISSGVMLWSEYTLK